MSHLDFLNKTVDIIKYQTKALRYFVYILVIMGNPNFL